MTAIILNKEGAFYNVRNGNPEYCPLIPLFVSQAVAGPTAIIAANTTKKTRIMGGIFQTNNAASGILQLRAGTTLYFSYGLPTNAEPPLHFPVTKEGFLFETAVNEAVNATGITQASQFTLFYIQYTP